MSLTDIKTQALAEISKLDNAAVAEYLKLKVEQFSGKTLVISVGLALIAGIIIGHVV